MSANQNTECVAVFTTESMDDVLMQHGTQYWRLNPGRVRSLSYVVCIQNARHRDTRGSYEHSTAFLVGRISGVVPSGENRYRIEIGEYAEVDIAGAWSGDRYPVRYTTLDDLGIDANDLNFHAMPEREESSDEIVVLSQNPDVVPLGLTEAKLGLAATLGVAPEAIEITVKA